MQEYDYDSFGNIKSTPFWVKQPYTYTARELDYETGLYYYRARYYDPKVGRFITRDPIGFGGGINVYAYVKNNPIRFKDPEGKNLFIDWFVHIHVEEYGQKRLDRGALWEKEQLKNMYNEQFEFCKIECLKNSSATNTCEEDKDVSQCLNKCVDEYYRKINDLDRWDVY